ncbi:MAG: selenium metabolism-associated LysR family transcriptional regulator [Nitrospirae bacterium]|nr:selenium metabolism-associated LysR family transcriptional regulator [Nitrospirota bacterium]
MEHKLKVFCTVAETKSFSKTSEIIHLTQPAVSLQIQALEEKYETKLFDRSSSKVNLTPAGEVLYKYAKDILALYASAEKVISEMTGLVKGSITIGAGSTIGNYLLPSVITDFRKAHPKIKVHLLIGNMQKVIELLNSGNINIGFVEGDVKRHKMFSEKLVSDELLVIVPSYHQWAQRKEISATELIGEPFIFREAGSSTRQTIEKFLSRHGITTQDMKVSMVLGSTEAIKDAVENGLGISIISQWAARKENKYGTLHLINLKEEKIVRNFSLLLYKNSVSTHAVDEFLTCMRAYPFEKLLS